MARRPYRVEVNYPRRGKPQYYLAKDVKVGKARRKVKVYLGAVPPTQQDVEQFRKEKAGEIELRAAAKRAELVARRLKSNYLAPDRLREIEELHAYYQGLRELLSSQEIIAYEKKFELAYVSGTTQIEGNTLSEREAADLLEYGILPQNKKLREVNEVQNFRKVISYRNNYRGKVSLEFIRNLHALVMSNIDDDSAGAFRRVDDIGIAGCDLPVTPSIFIEDELVTIIREYYDGLEQDYHPFEAAVLFHYKFEMIHPFTDGNGRVGREILNFMLRRAGYPRLLFLGNEREYYLDSLRSANKNDFQGLIDGFVALLLEQHGSMSDRLQQVAQQPFGRGQMRLRDFT